MTLYGTGMRRTEVSLLKVSDIDSQRMMIRVERGKGGAGRDIPLSPALLETLREYWRWKNPRICLFPSSDRKRGKEQPISDKTVWHACIEAARHTGLALRLEPNEVAFMNLDLRGVFDDVDPLIIRNKPRQDIQQGGFPVLDHATRGLGFDHRFDN